MDAENLYPYYDYNPKELCFFGSSFGVNRLPKMELLLRQHIKKKKWGVWEVCHG